MLRTLYAKLALALLLVFLAVALVQVALTVRSTRLYQQEVAQKLNRELASHLAQDKVLLSGGEVDRAALAEVFHMLMVINPAIEIYLLDREGAILAYSAPAGKVRRDRVSLGPVRRFLDDRAALPVFGDDPRSRRGGRCSRRRRSRRARGRTPRATSTSSSAARSSTPWRRRCAGTTRSG